jgi:hypothetical protein
LSGPAGRRAVALLALCLLAASVTAGVALVQRRAALHEREALAQRLEEIRTKLVETEGALGDAKERIDGLTRDLTASEAKLEMARGEIARLSDTAQNWWNRALQQEREGDEDGTLALLEELQTRFPKDELAAEAKGKVKAIVKRRKAMVRTWKRAFAKLKRETEDSPDLATSFELTVAFGTESPAPNDDLRVAYEAFRDALKERAKEDIARREAAKELGVEISEIVARWEINPNVMGGRPLLHPHLRFKVTNRGEKPIENLVFGASFELAGKKEVFGEGSAYPVGFSDPPLKPGYSREVFFGSSTGYTVEPRMIALGWVEAMTTRPAMVALLWIEVNRGPRREIRKIRVSKDVHL